MLLKTIVVFEVSYTVSQKIYEAFIFVPICNLCHCELKAWILICLTHIPFGQDSDGIFLRMTRGYGHGAVAVIEYV